MGAWLHAPSTIRQRWVWPAASFTAVIPNFVGYIDISDLNAVFNNALRADGLDVRCFIEDVAAVLDRELVDTYNQGAQTGQLYVRFNASNAADTVMEIYGGAGDLVANDTGTWTGAGYLAVWHLEEAAGLYESSSGIGDGTVTNGNRSIASQIEDGWENNNDNTAEIQAADEVDFNDAIGDSYCCEMWVKWNGFNNFPFLWSKGYSLDNTDPEYLVGVNFQNNTANNNRLRFIKRQGVGNRVFFEGSTNINDLVNFHHVVFSTEGGIAAANQYMWYDGGAEVVARTVNVGVIADTANTKPFIISREENGTYYSDATFDEIRWSNQHRDDDWVSAQYNNQDDPGAFYTPGAVEYPPAPVAGGPLPGESIMGIGIAMGLGV